MDIDKQVAAFQYGLSLFGRGSESEVKVGDLKARLTAMNLDEINAVSQGMDVAIRQSETRAKGDAAGPVLKSKPV